MAETAGDHQSGGKIIFKLILSAICAALVILTPAAAAARSSAPGQSKADYYAWLAQSAENREAVRSFGAFLARNQVQGVVPVWQLVRTSSSWRQCGAGRFEVAPAQQWANIVETLAFVKNEVRAAIGEVEALSVFRNERLNSCSDGAPRSAHRMFFAIDLAPVAAIDRNEMIGRICGAHARRGAGYETGLGFYSGARFHIDSNGFRKWGANGRSATSPCGSSIA